MAGEDVSNVKVRSTFDVLDESDSSKSGTGAPGVKIGLGARGLKVGLGAPEMKTGTGPPGVKIGLGAPGSKTGLGAVDPPKNGPMPALSTA
jgi:hypothetical protein